MNFKLGCGDRGVQRYIQLRKSMVPKCMRMFMVEFYRQVTISTPVDTGRARWGWNCSIKAPDLTVPPPAPDGWKGKSSKKGKAFYGLDTKKSRTVFTVQATKEMPDLYVANAVPYIGILNNGSSQQAPARFVELAFENALQKLEIYISMKGYDREN